MSLVSCSHVSYKGQCGGAYVNEVLGNYQLEEPKPENISGEEAIDIAVKKWREEYGFFHILGEYPYSACKAKNYWLVSGSLPMRTVGGTAFAIVDATSGEIVHFTHFR